MGRTRKQDVDVFADLFCGAGGTTTGAMAALDKMERKYRFVAVNHWDIAIETHSLNHPDAEHACQSISSVHPEDLVPGRRLKILFASPECTDHSNAKGGKPRSDQKRADAWLLMRWIQQLYVENLVIENVKEFVNWGPLTAKGKPDKRYRGQYFRQFISALEINYSVEWKILNSADYGDATERKRFFLIAKRGKGKKIFWPQRSHASRKELAKNQSNLFENHKELQPWRSAREIIDWDLKSKSIFNRKKPLSDNTMKRIFAGLFKYSLKPLIMGTGGPTGQQMSRSIDEPVRTILTDNCQNLFEPILMNLKGSGRSTREINEPLFTQTTGSHQAIVESEAYTVSIERPMTNRSVARPVEEPIATVTGTPRIGLLETDAFVIGQQSGAAPRNVSEPIPTVAAAGAISLIETEAFVMNLAHTGKNLNAKRHSVLCKSIEEPLSTVAGKGMFALLEPYIVPFFTEGSNQKPRTRSIDEPAPTVTTHNRMGVAEPFIVPTNHGDSPRAYDIADPMKTITSVDAWALAQPYIVKFYSSGDNVASIDEPLGTVTTKERFGLCIPQLDVVVDIRFRMLQPHELSAAMSFPKNYQFAGNRAAKVKQIGNAVPVRMAEALCRAVLEN